MNREHALWGAADHEQMVRRPIGRLLRLAEQFHMSGVRTKMAAASNDEVGKTQLVDPRSNARQ